MKNKILKKELIEKRFSLLRTFLAIVISLAIAFILIYAVSDKPIKDFMTLMIGPLKSVNNLMTIVTKAIPFSKQMRSNKYCCRRILFCWCSRCYCCCNSS